MAHETPNPKEAQAGGEFTAGETEGAKPEKTVYAASLDAAEEVSGLIQSEIIRDNPERAEIIDERARQAFKVRCELAETLDDVRGIKNAFTLGLKRAEGAVGIQAGVTLANELKENNWDVARIEDALEGMFVADLYGHAPARAIATLEKMGEGRGIPAKDIVGFHLPEINNAARLVATSEEMTVFGIEAGLNPRNYLDYLEDSLRPHGFVKKEDSDGIPYFEEEKNQE